MSNSMHCSIRFALVAAISLGFASQADALTAARFDHQAATGVCQGNSAVYGSSLRFRPLSVDNTGTTDQFVSCALQGDDQDAGRGSIEVSVLVANNDTVWHDVTCTLVNGYKDGSTTNATYVSHTVSMGPGRGGYLVWSPGELGVRSIDLPQIQCLLPARTALDNIGKDYYEDVGS